MRVGFKRRHRWWCVGGSGDWEVWSCHACGRTAIPTPFGFLWPWPRCKTYVIAEVD
jgi:hypothetical protein